MEQEIHQNIALKDLSGIESTISNFESLLSLFLAQLAELDLAIKGQQDPECKESLKNVEMKSTEQKVDSSPSPLPAPPNVLNSSQDERKQEAPTEKMQTKSSSSKEQDPKEISKSSDKGTEEEKPRASSSKDSPANDKPIHFRSISAFEFGKDATKWYRTFLHPKNWFFYTNVNGDYQSTNTYYPPYRFHPNSRGVKTWAATYNWFVLLLVIILPWGLWYGPESMLRYSLLCLAFTTVDVLIKVQTAIIIDHVPMTDFKELLKRRICNGVLILDAVGGLPWSYLFPNFVFLHSLLFFRLFDSRECRTFGSFKKLAKKMQINVHLVNAIKAILIQILGWCV
jgi:hypothetical protein